MTLNTDCSHRVWALLNCLNMNFQMIKECKLILRVWIDILTIHYLDGDWTVKESEGRNNGFRQRINRFECFPKGFKNIRSHWVRLWDSNLTPLQKLCQTALRVNKFCYLHNAKEPMLLHIFLIVSTFQSLYASKRPPTFAIPPAPPPQQVRVRCCPQYPWLEYNEKCIAARCGVHAHKGKPLYAKKTR